MKNKATFIIIWSVVLLFASQAQAQPFHFDRQMEDSVRRFLIEEMKANKVFAGQAIVMETQSGRIKARMALKKEGDGFVPYWDAFNEERTSPQYAATYLALMASGNANPEDTVYTEKGVFQDIYDHNYKRGGYGTITLEQALSVCSKVALQKATDKVFRDNIRDYEQKIADYHNGDPYHLMGMLTFYNAVANGGKMVKPITQGRAIVIDETFEKKEAIDKLKVALKLCVKDGLFKKAGVKGMDVAACGRTFEIGGGVYRMEECAFFPADNPKYTVMVVLEKVGLPASAGGMCGPVIMDIAYMLMNSIY